MQKVDREIRKNIVENATKDRKVQLKKCLTCDFLLTCWLMPNSKECLSFLKNYGGKQ